MDKKSARIVARQHCDALSDDEKRLYSASITKAILPYLQDAKEVFIYFSLENEVDTSALIKNLAERGVRIYTPKTVGNNMLLTEYDSASKIVRGQFGLKEVDAEGKEYYDADINIIPLVAYDKFRNRCGHGKGYYDRYLSQATGKVFALAFSAQEVALINVERHDVKPQYIFTEKGIIK